MKELAVPFPDGRTSPLYVGVGLLEKCHELFDLSKYTSIFVLTEPVVYEHWFKTLESSIGQEAKVIQIESGEYSKSIEGISSVWKSLLEGKADRKSLLINLGGGMITDLGGFAASTYMRGMDCINIPTTLLAQVDASIGGKTGINFNDVKNCIGTFSQPIGVVIDIDTLSTLPKRDLASGFSEVIKHGYIADKDYLNRISEADDLLKLNKAQLEEIVFRSCEIKKDVVARDEEEGGHRKILNFGHTLGHAIESLSHKLEKPLQHGEAIALGMIGELHLSTLNGEVTEGEVKELVSLLERFQLPTKISSSDYPFEALYGLMTQDKKNTGGNISWSLLEKVGSAIFDQKVEKERVEEAVCILYSDL